MRMQGMRLRRLVRRSRGRSCRWRRWRDARATFGVICSSSKRSSSMKKKLTEAQLIKRDAGRNIGEELLQAVREIKAGKTGRVFNVEVTEAAEARTKLGLRSEEHTSELQSLMRISYAVFCLKKKNK